MGDWFIDHDGFRFALPAPCISAHLAQRELLDQPVLLELLTAKSHVQRRPFHGHVIAFERVGSLVGLVRNQLLIEPWLLFQCQWLAWSARIPLHQAPYPPAAISAPLGMS